VIVSLLDSLRQNLATCTLSSIIDEILHWARSGTSCFARQLKKLKRTRPDKSVLDTLLPVPDG
jgi:hypothetical protein